MVCQFIPWKGQSDGDTGPPCCLRVWRIPKILSDILGKTARQKHSGILDKYLFECFPLMSVSRLGNTCWNVMKGMLSRNLLFFNEFFHNSEAILIIEHSLWDASNKTNTMKQSLNIIVEASASCFKYFF